VIVREDEFGTTPELKGDELNFVAGNKKVEEIIVAATRRKKYFFANI
jgi:hypothetical protein